MRTNRAGGRHGTPWRAAGAAVVLTVAMAGAAMLGVAMRPETTAPPPQPLTQAGPTPSADRADPDLVPPSEEPRDGAAALPRSQPTAVSIPQIGVHARIVPLGTNPDGTVQTPPLEQADLTGWYEPGASPGETGNAVIVGHVDNRNGPAVFWELGALQPGSSIRVSRADGRTLTFTVEAVRSYPKTDFPSTLVYGPNDRPGLRLVTCGGQFDRSARTYLNNTVVFATLAE
ncbi:peptidase C60 [Micromonospora rosaria]|uniref:Peptidase C60 n=1 Tax=Micromonospora rosaria TaxID=47874 RepID=A0A136PVL3_9ACTN|nr:class F sortase [Micromonospora rosaria]KXK62403.1 peptidase C60 [Micromonospora rosaria]